MALGWALTVVPVACQACPSAGSRELATKLGRVRCSQGLVRAIAGTSGPLLPKAKKGAGG